MKILKKFLFYIIMIMTFALSFSSEDAKIYLDRKIEPAKLKIGVTKLKTKELPLDFNIEEKTIFGYLPDSVTDNHLIFISETLDEMPSLSTTNGRRSINNIKKYLTKDIKVAPKFTYQVLVGDKENGIEEGKKYLLINCKTVLSGVYVYVVEKDTYHVKEVYKGKFNVPTTLAETSNYGEIKFLSKHELRDGDRITSTTGQNIGIVRGGNFVEQSSEQAILLGGEFPKKHEIPDPDGVLGGKRIKIKLGTGTEGMVTYEDGDRNRDTFEVTLDSKLERATINESLKFYTIDNSDYLYIQLVNWKDNSALETKVTIEYYKKNRAGNDYELEKTDSFYLNIALKENSLEQTKGIIAINENHKFNSTEKLLTYDGTSLIIGDDKNIEYAKLTYQYPKRNIFDRDDVYVQIIHNDVILLAKDGLKVSKDGEFESGEIKLKRATNSNVEIGSMKIESKTDSEYLKFYIRMDKRFRDATNNNIKLRYLVKDKDYGYFTILKTDEIQINIAPNKEELEENTRGGIFVYSSGGLNTDKVTTQGGDSVYVIPGSSEDETIFNGEGASILGDFPKKIIIDKEKADWGDAQQIRITNESESEAKVFEIPINENGTFSTGFNDDNDDTPELSLDRDHSSAGVTKARDVNIGIKAESNYDYLIIGIYDYNADAKTVLNKTMKLEYQALIENNWVTKRTDRLKVVIQTQDLGKLKPEISIDGPPVWYDYNTSGSDVGVRAFRKVELLNDTATTMSHWESEFIKNTTLNGKNWIDVKNIPEYTYFYRHRIEINGGNGEVIKWTDANGKTQSSSFINIGNGNQIMVAYDGNDNGNLDKSLSFGLSKYNFDGGTGTVFIAHYGTKDELLNIQGYDIKIAKFNGLDYVDNTKEIQTSSDYIKEYCFEQEINTNPVEIEYGTVGLRDLDTRITEKFGGEGIEIRATNEVTLVGEGEFSNYRIPALLYFKKETTPIYHEDSYKGQKYTILKGANEKALEGQLYLWVPSQEYLIPKGRFKIVERNNENASPLRVGVVVNNNKEKHFKEITDLYLNITTQRFVTTDIIFKNPIPEPEALRDSWIYLNKKDYPNGTPIPSYIGESWGRVQGEVIDIPVNKVNSVENLVLEVYGENYDKTTPLIKDLTGKELPISMGKNTITISYDSGKTYLRFKTSYPYTLGEEGSFYIRYRNKETGNYLFTQKYNVYYEDKNELRGDTTIHFKNPMMLGKYSSGSTGVIGGSSNLIYIDRSKNSLGKVDGNGNHNTKQDSQQWWEIKKAIDYPNIIKKEGIDYYYYDIFEDSLCKKPLYPSDSKYNIGNFEFYIIFNQEKENNYSTLGIGIANLKNGYNGEKLEKEIYIRWRVGGRDEETLEKIDRVKIVVDNFDPTYYGKVFPSEIDDTSPNNYKKINYVGEGYEYLDKTKTDEYIY